MKRGAILITLLVLFLYNFPNFYGYINPPKDKVYLGQVSWFDPWDINVYVSAIRWSQTHGLKFQNAYTTMPHKPIVLYPLYTLLGVLFPSTNPFLIFNISTVIAGGVLMLTIYRVSQAFLKRKGINAALFLIPLAGGFGWLFYPKVFLPDITMTPFTFASTFQRAHEALAISFYLISLSFYFLGQKRNSLKYLSLSGLALGVLAFIYPFYLLSFYLIFFIYALFLARKRKSVQPIKNIFLPIALSLPPGILYSLHLLSSTAFKGVFSPNLPTPNPISLFLGYGILSTFLLMQFFLKRKWSEHLIFLNTWFLLSIILSYLPTGFARYYLRALLFPATLLVLSQLKDFSLFFKTRKKSLVFLLVILLPTTTFIILSARFAMAFGVGGEISNWSYVAKEEYDLVSFLNKNTKKGVGVLSAYFMGNIIPANTGSRVYFGHYYQTPNSQDKIKVMSKFYANQMMEEEAKNFLQEEEIKYIVWSSEEKEITKKGGASNLRYPFLKKIFENDKATIYEY